MTGLQIIFYLCSFIQEGLLRLINRLHSYILSQNPLQQRQATQVVLLLLCLPLIL